MELTNEFRVGVPMAQAWEVLTDVERIAPCMPGAELQEVEGDEYRGVLKVKVGPITAQYKGAASFVERDEAGRRAVLRAQGRDTRGAGNANATITATLSEDGDGTRVEVVTDLAITGKVAQFGRGVLADVSAKLLDQFAERLEADVLSAAPPPSSPAEAAPAPPASAGSTDGGAAPSVRRVESAPAAPVDLFDAAGGSVARRVGPAVGAVLFLAWVFTRRRRRRRP
jgi:carbon monoxide dehydrogenase subunit G